MPIRTLTWGAVANALLAGLELLGSASAAVDDPSSPVDHLDVRVGAVLAGVLRIH